MNPNQDWIELLELLNAHNVEYLIVGAYALALHGLPRYTGDLDIFVNPSVKNALRLHRSLIDFGAPVGSLDEKSMSVPKTMITFGVEPSAVDILNWLSGIDFEDADSDALTGMFGRVSIRYLSLRAFRKNKKASGRPQDLADLSRLPES